MPASLGPSGNRKSTVMSTFSRRNVIRLTALLGSCATVLALMRLDEAPPHAWVREQLWGDDLLAYTVWDGVPRALVRDAASENRLYYDQMIRGDWFWPNWPPRPQWQFSGLGYSIAVTGAPASVGLAPCAGYWGEHCGWPLELFGQINDASVVALEVESNGSWRRFAVGAPGFAVRLDGTASNPTGYRWLDATGQIVWETARADPTSVGAEPASPHRRRRIRRRATPFPAATP